MKFTVNREKFYKALNRVASIISSRPMYAILSNIQLKAQEGFIELTTTDLELRITTEVEAEVETTGIITVPAKKLVSLINNLSGDVVVVSTDENDSVKIVFGNGRFSLSGLDAADFPEQSEFESIRTISLEKTELKKMISSVAYSVSDSDSRKVLTGILVSIKEGLLTLVATDGKRMALQQKNLESFVGTDGDSIIPLKAMNEAKRLLENEGKVEIIFGEKQCVFVTENSKLTTKLIEGNYPNYRQVIPSEFKQTIDIPVATFKNKIDIISLLLSDKSPYIILDFEDNKLVLSAASGDIGEGSDEIEIEYASEPFNVSFNPNYLSEPLRNTDAEMVRLKVNDPLNPVAIEGHEGFLYVIMPIRKK